MRVLSRFLTAALLGSVFMLSACESAEEKAEEYYQSALEFIEAGDFDRAIVELRNVFQHDKSHLEARYRIAELQLKHRGDTRQAYAEYLRLSEQYPDELEARIVLSELAFEQGVWDELERHGKKAAELAPEDPRVLVIAAAQAYREAVLSKDGAAMSDAAGTVESLLGAAPDSKILHTIVIDHAMRGQDYARALSELEWMIERVPEDGRFREQRLQILGQLGDMDALEAELRAVVEQFPDSRNYRATLLQFYMNREDMDQAEGVLRDWVAIAEADDTTPRLDLIRFLATTRGSDAARAEIEAAVSEHAQPIPFRVAGAALDFSEGDRENAVAALEVVVQESEPSEQTRSARIALARMLVTMGNEDGAQAQVETVLSEEATNPEALKMKAAWQIKVDETDLAIAGLRIALDQAPDDSQAMTLMAEAYIRSGRAELANDLLARAVEASGNAPAETLRYARILMEKESYLPAEDVLLKGLRRTPGNQDLLVMAGRLYLQTEDYGRAQNVAEALRRIGNEDAEQMANQLEAERISRQTGNAEAVNFLEQFATDAEASLASKITLIRARVSSGDAAGALELAEQLVQENPDDEGLRAVLGTVQTVNGDLDAAEGTYRDLIEADPERPRVWQAISGLQLRKGDPKAARDAIAEGRSHMPDDNGLLLLEAVFLEQDGDIEGAIEIYEGLYERNSSAPVVANNLASLLSTHRTDEASIERAWMIARRFREAENPEIQDTYGWLSHLHGDSEEALSYLEAAAASLPGEPLVQYHLGQVYMALERREEARAAFEAVLETADARGDTGAHVADARAQLESLQQPPAPTEQ